MDWPTGLVAAASTVGVFAFLAVFVWQTFKTAQIHATAKVSTEREAAYRALAEEVAAGQQRLAAALTEVNTTLTELRARVAKVERLMREVG